MTTNALFEPTARGYRATGFARGPWDPGATPVPLGAARGLR